MSGVFIKGFSVPNNCGACPLRLAWCRERIYMVERPQRCPLVPVPDHGRLIDADALPNYDKPIGKLMMFGGEYVYTQTAIDQAPTIIPTDKEADT